MKRTWTESEHVALARLFSSTVVRELARRGRSSVAARLLCESSLTDSLRLTDTLEDVFESAFAVLRRERNRHEYIYKNAIAQKELLGVHSLNTSCMLTEFRAGSSATDVVILNGTSAAYEIKSERDKLDRLLKQIDDYLSVFDLVHVIAAEKHLCNLEKTIPAEVGIQLLTDRYRIRTHRPAMSNVAKVSPEHIFDSLQRIEYLAVLDSYGITVPPLPNTQIHPVAKQLFCSLSPEQAHRGMVSVLKNTRSPRALKEFILSVPNSLKAAAISTPLTYREQSRFVDSLGTKLRTVLEWVGA